jgi:hypothetical protein
VALVIAPCVAGATASGCYGPTEIGVSVTTTVRCELGIETQLFTGNLSADPSSAPAAETRECGTAEPRIGTLVIVPSGARDDRFDLEVVAGVGGVSVASCLAKTFDATTTTKGCIFARRRVSFLPHKSLSLPMLLSDRCVNVPCTVDTTCDLGTCTPTTECTESGCPRERGDVVVVVVDAGAGAEAGSSRCGASPAVVIEGQSIVGPLAVQGDDFVYVNRVDDGGTISEIRRVPRAGASTASVVAPSVESRSLASYVAVAANADTLVWATQSQTMTSTSLTLNSTDGRTANISSFFDRTTLAFSGNVVVGVWHAFAATPTQAFTFEVKPMTVALNGGVASLPGDVAEILTDEDGHFFGVSNPDVVFHETVTDAGPTESGRITSLSGVVADIAVTNRTLYVAAHPAIGTQGIFRIARDGVKEPYNDVAWLRVDPPASLPQSLATDGKSLYFLLGTALVRATLGAGPPTSSTLIGTTGASSDRLVVDDQCVYWVERGTRIMRQAK